MSSGPATAAIALRAVPATAAIALRAVPATAAIACVPSGPDATALTRSERHMLAEWLDRRAAGG